MILLLLLILVWYVWRRLHRLVLHGGVERGHCLVLVLHSNQLRHLRNSRNLLIIPSGIWRTFLSILVLNSSYGLIILHHVLQLVISLILSFTDSAFLLPFSLLPLLLLYSHLIILMYLHLVLHLNHHFLHSNGLSFVFSMNLSVDMLLNIHSLYGTLDFHEIFKLVNSFPEFLKLVVTNQLVAIVKVKLERFNLKLMNFIWTFMSIL